MSIRAVIFDWGGTLTPWKSMDVDAIWRQAASRLDGGDAEALASRLKRADAALWRRSKESYRSFTLGEVFAAAEVEVTHDALGALRRAWEPATYTDPQATAMLAALRDRGLRVGILSNTPWPRPWHEQWLRRDGVLDAFDATVFTSELPWNKPHPESFRAAAAEVGAAPAECVYVGDRLFEDVWGPQELDMRTVHIPHSRIPDEQRGHTEGTPDAVIAELAELPAVLDRLGAAAHPRR